MRKFLTLIRRELWEHKTGFIVLPIICTLILSLLLSIGYLRFAPPPTNTISSPTLTENSSTDLNQQFSAFNNLPINQLPIFSQIDVLNSAAGFLGFAQAVVAVALAILLLIVTFNYAHRALFDDRKNREILFWRSMPVSETENLLAKLAMIYGLAPLMVLAMTFLTGLISWLAAAGHGAHDAFLAITKLTAAFSAYKNCLLVFLALLPVFSWTLLASAYAKKSPFLLSTFMPIGLIVFDRFAHWATGINLYIRASVSAYTDYLTHSLQAINTGISSSHIPASVLVILVSALFLGCTLWLRNHRYEL